MSEAIAVILSLSILALTLFGTVGVWLIGAATLIQRAGLI